jgi:hypothetical protein
VKAILMAIALTVVAAACGERAQSGPSMRKSDTPAWDAAQDPFVVPGWKSGDRASWESQMHERAATGQDEYPRTTPRS